MNLFPHYLAWKNQQESQKNQLEPNYIFSGQLSWFDPWDVNVYVAAIKWGQQNHFLLKNRYTSLEHQSSLVYPVYTLLGKIFPQQNAFLLFHASTVFSGTLLFIIIYFLVKKLWLKNSWLALATTFLINFSGGLGWLFTKNKISDMYMTALTFTSARQRPHEAIGIVLYLVNLCFYWLYLKQKNPRNLLIGFFASLILIIFYPYYLLNIALIIFTYAYIKSSKNLLAFVKNHFQLICCFLLTTILTILYWLHLQKTGFNSIATQKLNTYSLFNLLLGYGLSLALTLFFLWKKYRHLNDKEKFLLLWFGISFALSFLPLGFSRFYLRALFFPLITFLALQLQQLALTKSKLALLIFNCALFVLPLSNIFIFIARIKEVDNFNNYWIYQPKETVQAINFLNQQAENNVLTLYRIGNYLPAVTNKNVAFGHLIQTPNAKNLEVNIDNFYAQKLSSQQAKNFLDEYQIDYVWLGTEEQTWGIINYPFLEKIYTNGVITIYKN